MTVQYNQLVLTGGPCVFFRLLLKWRGCVFKLIYLDLIIFIILYTIISCIYRFALSESAQRSFENVAYFTNNVQQMIPVAFILGFYINLIFNRFWYQFMTIPWGLSFSIALVSHMTGTSERVKLIRKTCLRYIMGSLILTLTRIHLVAKKRFPTPESFVHANIFTHEEVKLIHELQPVYLQPFVPIVWTTSLITLAEKEGFIRNHHTLVLIINEVNNFRQGLLNLFLMDYVCVPLVYTQVVTLSVYMYFLASLIGRQHILASSPLAIKHNFYDLYIPFFTIAEFVIYVGWLKVAQTLINPMGEDDEDLDFIEIINYNWTTTHCIVNEMKLSPPALIRDKHWDQSIVELPHTEESRRLASQPYRGSLYEINPDSHQHLYGSLCSLNAAEKGYNPALFRKFWRTSTSGNVFGDRQSILDLERDRDAFISASTSVEMFNPIQHTDPSEPTQVDGSPVGQPPQGISTSVATGTITISEPIEEETEEELKEAGSSFASDVVATIKTPFNDTAPHIHVTHFKGNTDHERDAIVSASTSLETVGPIRHADPEESRLMDRSHLGQPLRGLPTSVATGTITISEPIEEETEDQLRKAGAYSATDVVATKGTASGDTAPHVHVTHFKTDRDQPKQNESC